MYFWNYTSFSYIKTKCILKPTQRAVFTGLAHLRSIISLEFDIPAQHGPSTSYTHRSFSAMEAHAMKLPAHGFCADVNPSGGLEFFVSLQSCVTVVPKHFHFAEIPLKAGVEHQREEKNSQADLFQWWHAVIAPHFNSLSSLEQPILLQMFKKGRLNSWIQRLRCVTQ